MPAQRQIDRRSITVLSAGHACVDICQGAIPALIPFLVIRRGYSYSEATALLLAITASSSMLQPLFGHVSDLRSLSWLLPGGILLAGVGLGIVGLTSSFALTIAAVCLTGTGVAAYHPEGARFANYVAGTHLATGMSLYAVGGNVGFALGSIFVTILVLSFGIGGVAWIALPLIVAALLLAIELSRLNEFGPSAGQARGGAPEVEVPARQIRDPAPDRWLPFTSVAAIAAFRSATYFALQAFVPLWFIQRLDQSAAVGNTALVALLAAGAVGTLVGGRMADRVGERLVLIVSLGLVTPLTLIFLALNPAPAVATLALIGFFTVGTFSITVVMGQQYLPGRVGLASGVTLGAAIGIGGLMAWLLSLLADQTGLLTVLLIAAALPVPALVFALTLPPTRPRTDRLSRRGTGSNPGG